MVDGKVLECLASPTKREREVRRNIYIEREISTLKCIKIRVYL